MRCRRTALLWAVLSACGMAAEFHVERARGDDGALGTNDAPLKTLCAAMNKAKGGDVILLGPGDYAAIDRFASQPWTSLYRGDFVTIQPAPGVEEPRESITIERIHFGKRAGQLAGEERRGKHDAWLRVRGVRIPDGVYLFGYNHLHIEDCRVERRGPHTGTPENIEKFAVTFGCGDDLVVRDSEITSTAGGVVLSSHRGKVIGNTIHDITHDGIRCVSSKHCLVEGNRIFNLDDGVEDGDPRGKGWNRHCDAIHIFIPGPGLPRARNSDLTIRGNVMYNCESQAMQFNNYLRVKDVWNERVLIENNVFGPTRANVVNIADPVDGIIFRHNTCLHFPEGRSFEGRGRTIHCKDHTFRITPRCKRAHVYNNILVNAPKPQPGWFVSHNAVLGTRSTLTRFDAVVADPKFVDVSALDGKLNADSPAVNAGTALFAPTPVHSVDRLGTPRDARPDCGAFELPGQTPEPEADVPQVTEPVTTFLDGFKDGDLAADPWLGGEHQAGLSWEPPEGQASWRVDSDGKDNRFTAMGNTGRTWMLTREGGDWADMDVRLTLRNAYNKKGAGVLLRANGGLEGYLAEFAKGQIIKRKKDADGNIQETVLGAAKGMLPHSGFRQVVVTIEDTSEGALISVDVGADGTVELETVDRGTDRVSSGRLALMNDLSNPYHRTDWMDVRVELTRPVPMEDETTMIMFPRKDWQVATPESQGMDPAKLLEAVDYVGSVAGDDGIGQMVIVRNGVIVWQGDNVHERQRVWSCTKSFLSTCVGLAWDAGKLTPDTLVKEAVPEIGDAYRTVTIEHLATLTSGYAMDENAPLKPLPPRHAPGAGFHYSRQPDLLSVAVTRLTGSSLADLFHQGIAERIGIDPEDMEWQVFDTDAGRDINGGSGGPGRSVYITPLAMARFGWLYACGGVWDGKRVISQRYIDYATVPRTSTDLPPHDPEAWYVHLPGNYGLGWWTNGPRPDGKRHWPHAPARTFAAQGNKNNNCFIIPAWRMVVVRLGQDKIIDMQLYDRMFELLGESIGAQ